MAEEEDGKYGMASGEITEKEEERLLQALHLLGTKPERGSVKDVTKLLHASVFDTATKSTWCKDKDSWNLPFPSKCLSFMVKKEKVTWNTFKYEISALLCEKLFTHEQISLAIRRA